MKPIALLITNSIATYGGAQILRQAVLFVFVPDRCTTYDSVGRLTSETYNGERGNYTYDYKNNVQKAGLTYTNGVLTSVNGARIVYDKMGNPTTYKGNTFRWQQGRKLAGGSMYGNSFSYAYDGNGMRYEKKVNGATTQYYWNGDQLLMESSGTYRTWYIYGVTGVVDR